MNRRQILAGLGGVFGVMKAGKTQAEPRGPRTIVIWVGPHAKDAMLNLELDGHDHLARVEAFPKEVRLGPVAEWSRRLSSEEIESVRAKGGGAT